MRKLACLLGVVGALGAAACGDDADPMDMATRDQSASLDLSTAGEMGGSMTLTATLTTSSEVPVCASASAGATGSGTVTINQAGTSVVVSNFVFSGLSGSATMAHIHSGAAGVAGPIVLDFGANPTSPINRTFTAADYPSPAPANAPANFAAFVAAMRTGQSYFNVHTSACSTGEIRGQIM
jgi:hypothetical protein